MTTPIDYPSLETPNKIHDDITNGNSRRLERFLRAVKERLDKVQASVATQITTQIIQQTSGIVSDGLSNGSIVVPSSSIAQDNSIPTTPSGLVLTTSVQETKLYVSAALNISWNTASDNSGKLFYEVKYTKDGTNFTTDTTVNPSYVIFPVQIGQQYTVFITAIDYNGNRSSTLTNSTGTFPSGAFTITGDTTAPATPTNFTALGGLDKVILGWTNPADTDFIETHIFRSTVSGFTPGALSGTYSQTGTTITCTITNHGFSVGQSVTLTFTGGTAVTGNYTIVTIATNTFTVTSGTSTTTSGNVSTTNEIAKFRGDQWIDSPVTNGTTYYYILKSADVSGNLSLATAQVSATPNTITATNAPAYLAAGAIDAVSIAANAITTAKINTGAVTAGKISVSTLDAITANVGTLTAGNIIGLTIATVGSGGNVVQMDPTNGLFGLNAGTQTTFKLAINGSGFLGLSPGNIRWDTSGTTTINGSLQMVNPGNIFNGKTTAASTTAGFFLGLESSVAKFSVGDSTHSILWDGSALTVQGKLQTASSGQRIVLDNSANEFQFYDSTGTEFARFGNNSVAGGLGSSSTILEVGTVGAGTTFTGRSAVFKSSNSGAGGTGSETIFVQNTSNVASACGIWISGSSAADGIHITNALRNIVTSTNVAGASGIVSTTNNTSATSNLGQWSVSGNDASNDTGAYTGNLNGSASIYGNSTGSSPGVYGRGITGGIFHTTGGGTTTNQANVCLVTDTTSTSAPTHTATAGSLLVRTVSSTSHLYYCRGGTTWVQVI